MKINWTLELNDANAILAVLGKLPYEQVAVLIGSLQAQTQRAVDRQTPSPPSPVPAEPPLPDMPA
jgi:hypothetical protein